MNWKRPGGKTRGRANYTDTEHMERCQNNTPRARHKHTQAEHRTGRAGIMTAHYITEGKINQKVLKNKAMYRAQTGAVIAEEIGGILDEFGIKSRVAVISVDHASNMNVAVNKFNLIKLGCLTHA